MKFSHSQEGTYSFIDILQTLNIENSFSVCSPWARDFLQRAYDAKEHDNNWQLGPDQAAILQALEAPGSPEKVKYVAKHACNVYPEVRQKTDMMFFGT